MIQINTHTGIWNKYLPVIRILLKKSLSGDQTLNLNIPDFERAGMARKTGYKFVIKIKDGRVDNVIVNAPLASSLASLLLQDPAIKEFTMQKAFQISMNPKFQLTIKYEESTALVNKESES